LIAIEDDLSSEIIAEVGGFGQNQQFFYYVLGKQLFNL
jgi:hypothetical protein